MGETAPNGPFLYSQLPSDIRLLPVLEVEEDERRPVGFRQVLDLVIQDGLYFSPFQLCPLVHGWGRLGFLLVLATPRGGPFRVMGHTVSNSMKPAGQRLLLANARALPGEKEEGRLKGVLRVLKVMQDAPTNAHHHRPVTFHQRREGGLVIAGREGGEQFPVCPDLVLRTNDASDITDDIA